MAPADDAPGLTATVRFTPRPLVPFAAWQTEAYSGNSGAPGSRARSRAFDTLMDALEVPWWDGMRLTLWPGEEMSEAIARTGGFEMATSVVFKRLLFPSACVIDAGANAGLYTILAARWCNRVVAAEPSPRELAKLRRNIAINGFTNVTVLPAALGATAGRATLRVSSAFNAGHNTLAPRFAYDQTALEAEMEVPVTTIDSLNLPADLIKIDVEGAEVDLLRGAWRTLRTYRPTLIIEANALALEAYGAGIEPLAAVLRELRYAVFDISSETAALVPLRHLADANGENVVARPAEAV